MPSIKLSKQLLISVVVIFALVGCGEKNSKGGFRASSGHPANWEVDHRVPAKADIESCIACHGTNLDGGIAKLSCTKCHPASIGSSSVHLASWGNYAYARHSAYVKANGTSTCAIASCHGTDLAGGESNVSCTSCHGKNGSTYSRHKWVNYSSHATYIKLNFAQTYKKVQKTVSAEASGSLYPTCSVSRCHGADLKGVFLSGKSCYPCHPETSRAGNFLNHAESWGTAPGSVLANHGSHVVMTNRATCGTTVCHGTDFKGVSSSGPSCYACHAAGPFSKHPIGWGGYTKEGVPSHGLYVKALGTSSCATTICHGLNLAGGTVTSACNSCHSNLPATNPNRTSCYICHTGGPTSEHPLSWTISPLKNHGSYVKSNGYTSCAISLCHGANARGVTGSGSDCLKCHTTSLISKHPTTWTNGPVSEHPLYLKTNDYRTLCTNVYCHGVDGKTKPSQTAKACLECHETLP